MPKTIKTYTFQVVVPVSAESATGDIVGEMTRQDFKVLVDGKEIPDFQFLNRSNVPCAIGVSFDHDSRRVMARFPWIKLFISGLIHSTGREDQFFISTYGRHYLTLLKPVSDRTAILDCLNNLDQAMFDTRKSWYDVWKSDIRDHSKVMEESIAPINKTAIAVDRALHDLDAISLPRKALVLVSDGDENLAKTTLRHVQWFGYPIFSINLSGLKVGGNSFFKRGQMLRRISTETGGAVMVITGTDDPDALGRQLSRSIRSQYLISFSPPPGLSQGATHAIVVLTNRNGVKLYHRKSFRFAIE